MAKNTTPYSSATDAVARQRARFDRIAQDHCDRTLANVKDSRRSGAGDRAQAQVERGQRALKSGTPTNLPFSRGSRGGK